MTKFQSLSGVWNHLTLTARLMVTAVLITIVAVLGTAAQIAHSTVTHAQRELLAEHQQLTDVLGFTISSIMLAETADHKSDLERLKALIEDFHRTPAVTHVSYRDTSDAVVVSHDIPIALGAPAWFARWCGQEEIRGNQAVVHEGQYFGVITVGVSPVPDINRAWDSFLGQARMLILALGLVLLSTWWVLHRGLRPVHDLAAASDALGTGDLTIRLPVDGSPELRKALAGFNRMAAGLEIDRYALSASEQRHRTILRTAMDGIWRMDSQGRLLEVNEAYCRLSGYSEAELLAMGVTDVEAVEQPAEVAAHIRKVMENGADRFETRHRRKDGSLFDVEVSAQYRPEAGPWFVVFVRDITEHKRAAEKREELQAQLRQAQKMESIGRLAGGVAHDFNNLLTGIMNYVDLCRDQVGPGHPIRPWLDDIQEDARRSADLTRQLLAFARRQTIAPKVLDLNGAMSGMLRMLRRLLGEDIDLVWLPGRPPILVKMDPSQLDQLLANLTVNARDAMQGVGKLTIETQSMVIDQAYCAAHADAIPGDYAMLAVSDSGCGMNTETLAHLFEPFYTTKKAGEGTGLGLATVYGIVRQNNGFVNVYSEPGKGTTFRIYLPRHTAEADAPAPAVKLATHLGGTETILLVEDEKSIRVTSQRFLQAFGYTVLAAETPDQALRLAAEHAGDIHLLITDVVMPGLSGRDLATRLAEARPTMKCLFISGYTANVIAHRGILDKDVNFLGKPFGRDDLARKVREVLGGS